MQKIIEFLKKYGKYLPYAYELIKKIIELFKKKKDKNDGTNPESKD